MMEDKILYSIVKRPIITEKVMIQREDRNIVVFEVDKDSNKNQIKEAVEKLFKVSVIDVRTLVVRGKKVRRGFSQGKKKNWKKAIIELKKGDRIDYFEGS